MFKKYVSSDFLCWQNFLYQNLLKSLLGVLGMCKRHICRFVHIGSLHMHKRHEAKDRIFPEEKVASLKLEVK